MIGKKLTILIPDRDTKGNVIEGKYTPITGVCRFLGYNENINEYQITLDRSPIFPFDVKNIIKIHE